MKKLIFAFLIAVTVIYLFGILPYGGNYNIFPQANTVWQTKDGTMSIHVNESGEGILTVHFDKKEDKYLLLGRLSTIYVYDDAKEIATWDVFYHHDWFSAKVHDSDYFEEGTKIKFYRVDE